MYRNGIRMEKVVRWYQIELSGISLEIGTTDDVIIEVPRVIHWMRGKKIKEIEAWLKSRKAKMTSI